MSKRVWDGSQGSAAKKHKSHDKSKYEQHHRQKTFSSTEKKHTQNGQKTAETAHVLQAIPPSTTDKAEVPAYIPFKVSDKLPELPPLSQTLSNAPFRHKSESGYDRSSTAGDMSYERLEFLGDAYIELIASRLIYHHHPELTAGAQSQLRELLVKNETLAEYARAYGFEQRLSIIERDRLINDSRGRGNKGMNKVLGDVLEAYVAAAILSDEEYGFVVVEKWLTSLWAPKLLEGLKSHARSSISLQHADGASPLETYNPTAKAELQRRIHAPNVKLEYEPYRKSEELKGNQLGQNRHYIALYLTGYGYTRKLLGKGEGKNKVEAGNWAAVQAVHGLGKDIVQECAEKLAAYREARNKKAEDEAKQD